MELIKFLIHMLQLLDKRYQGKIVLNDKEAATLETVLLNYKRQIEMGEVKGMGGN